MVHCGKCGYPLDDEALFCERCGQARTMTPAPPRTSAKQILFERVRAVTTGRYDVRGEIGRGGMAAVFLAQDLRLNRRVALKVMLPGLAFTEGMSERFEQEARTAANLDHPNIVTIFAVEEMQDLLFFVMKYIEGRSLDGVANDVGPLPVDVAHFILLYTAMALAHAHDEGVVHRDVKPGNVLLDRRGTPIVTDFGIAKAAEAPSLTVAGAIIGTPAYMSPEQFRGLPAVPASDQYALGIMAYQMFIGEVPFTGSMMELQTAHLSELPTPIVSLRPEVPVALADLVMRMLEKDVGQRFASLHQVVHALRALPLNETVARARLVELGLLSGQVSPFGTAPTPSAGQNWKSYRTPGARSGEISSPTPATPPATPSEPRPDVPPAAATPAAGRPSADSRRTDPSASKLRATALFGGPNAPPPPKPSVAPETPLPAVAYVRIDSLPAQVTTGEVLRLHGTAYDANDTPIPGKLVEWEISPNGVGLLGGDGTMTLIAPGAVTVTAMVDGICSLAEMQVTPVPATRRPEPSERKVAPTPIPTVVEAPAPAPVASKPLASKPVALASEARTAAPLLAKRSRQSVALLATAGISVAAAVIAFLVFRPSSTTQPTPAPAATTEEPAAAAPTTSTQQTPPPVTPPTEVVTPEPVPVVKGGGTTVASKVEITNAPTTLALGAGPKLQAAVRGKDGATIPGAGVAWSSSDRNIVTITSNGTVRALKPGNATIRASSDGVAADVRVTVAPPRVTGVAIAEARPLAPGESETLRLTAQSDAGPMDAQQLAAIGLSTRWTSSAPETVRLDPSRGIMTAVAPGTATVTVEVAGVRATRAVTVRRGQATEAVTTPPAATQVDRQPPPRPDPPRPDPVRAETARAEPARATRTVEDVGREVRAVLRAYGAAMSARDIGAIERVYPTMPAGDKASLRQFFKDATDVTYEVVSSDFGAPPDLGDRAQVVMTMQSSLSFISQRDKKAQGPIAATSKVTLARAADGWHIVQIR